MFARIGGVLAPIINMLHNHNPTIPLVIFGTSPLLGAVLALALPETADRPLPDTVEDAENWDSRYYNVSSVFTLLCGYYFHLSWRLKYNLLSIKLSERGFRTTCWKCYHSLTFELLVRCAVNVSLLLSLHDPEQDINSPVCENATSANSSECFVSRRSPPNKENPDMSEDISQSASSTEEQELRHLAGQA